MKALPARWRVHDNEVEAEHRLLKRRFEAAERRRAFAGILRRMDRWACVSALVVIAGLAGYWALVLLSPWPPMVTLKHLAAYRNCDAARAVGLAPANRGEPGYWPSHDADNDGIACEPWPRRGRWR